MIFIKLSIFLLVIFFSVVTACYFFTKNKKYLYLAKTAINYLISIILLIAIVYFTLRYLHIW
ncbi:MAG: hypothetical protein CML63_11260 [Rhodobacteraceae bacterium]|nr:hypothetical protein [Paracoccaceae bacterium]